MVTAANLTGTESIVVRGVRVHNLKNINFEIPHSALTIVTAAMRGEIACAAAGAPYLCGFMDAASLTHSYPYQEINDYLRLHPDREEQVRRTVAYFDGINFAPTIRCPIIGSFRRVL